MGVKTSLFTVSQMLPDLPTAIAKENITMYNFGNSMLYMPMQVEPDQNMTPDYLMNDQNGQDLFEKFDQTRVEKGKMYENYMKLDRGENVAE